MKFDKNDPKWTAYALGELKDEERQAIEQELQTNDEARKLIEEIQSFSTELESALSEEPVVELTADSRDGVLEQAAGKESGKLLTPMSWVKWGACAAGIAALLLIAILPGRVGQDDPELQAIRITSLHKLDDPSVRAEPARLAHNAGEDSSAIERSAKPVQVAYKASEVREQQVFYDRAEFDSPDEKEMGSQVAMNSPAPLRGDYLVLAESDADGVTRQGLPPGTIRARRSLSIEAPQQQPYLSPSIDDFQQIQENKFTRVEDHPLSTFSIDVDTASYAVVRKMLNEGRLPPKDAVRIEELVNYFPYDYAPPTDGKPFAAHMESAPCPWNPEHALVRIALKGKEIPQEERAPLNLVYLIDVSGSMNPANKLPLVKRSLEVLARQLDERDRIAMVVYSGAAGLVLPPTRGDNTQAILEALNRLKAGGSTAGASGIQLAYEVAREHFDAEAVNRVIICTDGDFNVGMTQRGDLEDLIEKEAKSGVFLTALGFGMGNYKDSTLETLSNKGNGNYAYIDDFSEARRVLVDQMMGTLVTIAKDVKIQVEFNPEHVAGYRLIGYENRMLKKEDFNNDKVDAGEIGAGHTVTAFYEIVPKGKPVNGAPAVDALKYQSERSEPVTTESGEWLTLKLRYKQPDGDVSTKLEYPLVVNNLAAADPSRDFRFASAVAGFGMLLRDSEFKGNVTYESVEELARSAIGTDEFGYRAEFLRLVRNASALSGE